MRLKALLAGAAALATVTAAAAPASAETIAIVAGSVITDDVPAEAVALGRSRQVVKPGLARRLMERLRAAKKG